MSFGIRLEVWGDYAAFNRPEMKVERVSYDIMTPSAARGLLEAIYWKPQMRWVIDRIHALAPVQHTHVRRNEISAVIPANSVKTAMREGQGDLGIATEDHRQQRAGRILKNVRYGIEAHVVVRDATEADGSVLEHPEAKHLEMFKRRAERGQYFHHPYLGTREFPAHFRLLSAEDSFPSCPEAWRGERNLGFILWDINFRPEAKGPLIDGNSGARIAAEPRFFEAIVRDGVLDVPPFDETWG